MTASNAPRRAHSVAELLYTAIALFRTTLLKCLPFAMIAVLYYIMMVKPQRQREASHKDLLANLKKNDRVVTVGGIYGVVVNVQRDQDEVTIKVDENTNTKLRVTFSAIARVITDDAPAEKPDKE